MNSVVNAFIYNVRRFRNSYFIFSAIFLGILIFVKIIGLLFINGTQGNNVYDMVFLIYTFVYFIAIFKESYNHLAISGVTRKTFFISNIISIIFAAIVMEITAVIFIAFTRLLGMRTELILEMIFNRSSNFELFLLGFSFTVLASFVGWLFSLLTYRYGNLMILVIIFVPQILMTIIGAIIDYYGKTQSFYYYLSYYFGFAEGMTPYNTILNMLLTAAAVGAVNWLLMRRLPVRV